MFQGSLKGKVFTILAGLEEQHGYYGMNLLLQNPHKLSLQIVRKLEKKRPCSDQDVYDLIEAWTS